MAGYCYFCRRPPRRIRAVSPRSSWRAGCKRRPVTMWDVSDQSERYLDEVGLDRPHLAGHSMGGFIALELARRGRAASVCAFSPGGLWSDDLRVQVAKGVRRQLALGRLMRPITPFLMKSPGMRRRALTDATLHGDRLIYKRAIELTEVPSDCTIIGDICNNADEQVAPMDPLPCPITIAWAKKTEFSQSSCAKPSPATAYPARPSPSCPASGTLRRLTIPSWSRAPSSPSRVQRIGSQPPRRLVLTVQCTNTRRLSTCGLSAPETAPTRLWRFITVHRSVAVKCESWL